MVVRKTARSNYSRNVILFPLILDYLKFPPPVVRMQIIISVFHLCCSMLLPSLISYLDLFLSFLFYTQFPFNLKGFVIKRVIFIYKHTFKRPLLKKTSCCLDINRYVFLLSTFRLAHIRFYAIDIDLLCGFINFFCHCLIRNISFAVVAESKPQLG